VSSASRWALPAGTSREALEDLAGLADPATAALWPSAAQELLLKAALLEGAEGLAAWSAWKSSHDLVETHLDHGSFRLLPLVYRNLLTQGVDEPLMPRLKGIYRYWWCWNQRLFYRAAEAIGGLEEAGISTLLLKGTALSIQSYRDPGARPIGDVDLLVPYADAARAVEHLARIGWSPLRPRYHDLISYQHCVGMVHADGERLDLHWHVLRDCVDYDSDDGFWHRAVPVKLLDQRSRALGYTDALLHTIVHGMRWNEEPTMRWIPDAITILRVADGAIDWRTLRDEARERGMLLRVSRGMSYLRHRLGAPIPDEAMAMIRTTRPSVLERMEYRMLTFGSDRTKPLAPRLALVALQYLRFVSRKSLSEKLAATPAYFRYRVRGRSGATLDAVRWVRRGYRKLLALRGTGTPPRDITSCPTPMTRKVQ